MYGRPSLNHESKTKLTVPGASPVFSLQPGTLSELTHNVSDPKVHNPRWEKDRGLHYTGHLVRITGAKPSLTNLQETVE